MAYKKAELIEQAISAAKKYNLFFMEDVIAFLPCSRSTFYNHNLDELDELKRQLSDNKVQVKVSLRSQWYRSKNATLQLSLYKLICTPEERKKLNMNYVDHTSDGDPILPSISFLPPDEEANRLKAKEIEMKYRKKREENGSI